VRVLNSLAFYSLFLLTIIRLIGLGISLDLFLSIKKKRFLTIVAGWGMWVIAGLIPIVNEQFFSQNQLLKIFNANLAGEGLLLIFLGIFAYFHPLSGRFVFILSSIYLLLPFILVYTLGTKIALTAAIILHLITYVIIFLGVVRSRQEMVTVFSKGVKFFYLTIGVVILTISALVVLTFVVEDYAYGLYYTVDNGAVIINYSLTIIMTVLILILFIYIERGITADDKFQLKDRYSHDIGNLLQIMLAAVALMEANQLTPEEKAVNMVLIQSKCQEASDLLNEIREL
jgi:hypothetical protein